MNKTKKITCTALLSALAYIAMYFSRFLPPMFTAFPFLKYDPKDVIIVVGGFLYGPATAACISVIVSLVEMITVSGTQIIGCLMNIASSCAFACSAAAIYAKYRCVKGGGAGLVAGSICATAVMLVLNYFLTPLYTGMPREDVAALLVPAILPFNAIKCILNSAIVILIYKPVVKILRRSGIASMREGENRGGSMAAFLAAVFVIIACAAAVFVLNR